MKRTFRIAEPEHVASLSRLLSQCVAVGRPQRVDVQRWVKRRSGNQQRYQWGVVYAVIADHTGHTADEVHEVMKQMFCPARTIRIGDAEQQIRSTAQLSVPEMQGYLDQVIAFAAVELGLDIPSP